jgi:radical SAM superfamily enzyme YgiQ (UPF0313 family)
MLDIMQKDLTVEDILTATARLNRKGFACQGSFIGGYPGETEKDLDETIELIATLSRQDPRFSFVFNVFIPYPGTAASEPLLESGFRFPEHVEGWANFLQPHRLGASGAKRLDSLYDSDRVTWLTESRKRTLYKVQILSRAAGGPVYRSSSRLATALAFPYNLPIYIARFRWAKRLFGPVPELTILRFARKIGLSLYRRVRGGLPTR